MNGVVAAGSRFTAQAGADVLRAGGNAFDAAVCAVMASFSAESLLTGLGAGGFMLVRTAAGEDELLDFFVEAGGRGLDAGARSELVATEVVFDETPQIFNVGPSSCGVPGTAAGLWEAAARFCSMPFEELTRAGVRYARDGLPVDRAQAYIFHLLEQVITGNPETCALYAPEGRLLREGDTFRFPDLADALERLAAEGPGSIYRGEAARRICDWVSERGGLLSEADFASYRVIERDPVRIAYRGREVLTNAPPSSGGPLIAFALALLERGDARGAADPDALTFLVEVMGETNRAREGDFHGRLHEPGFIERFLSEASLTEAGARIADVVATGGGAAPGSASGPSLGSTTHLSVLDSAGNAASVTCSNGTSSGVLPPGTGVHLNNMLGEEDLNPLGFHQHDPGTRVTSMMAPTVVLRDGEVELVLGSAGSNRLRSAILQVIRHVVDDQADVTEAVRRGRLHYEAGILHAEPGWDAGALDQLERRGYRIVRWRDRNLYFGGVQAARRDSATGLLSGAGDPRRAGAVVVVN